MKYTTIIAEKPSVAKSIAKIVGAGTAHRNGPCGYLEGNGYKVTWAFGHLIELQSPEQMGFDRNTVPFVPGEWKTRIRTRRSGDGKETTDDGAKSQMNTLRTLFEGAGEIIVATDAGREGELIFRYIYEYLGCHTPFRRLWISSLTDEAIREGMKNLCDGHAYDALSDSAHARSQADWLVGLNASRALRLSTGISGSVSLGRVQTPTLAMICRRHEENIHFQPKPFWVLTALSSKEGLDIKAVTDNYDDEAEADRALKSATEEGRLTVTASQTKRSVQKPPLLHDLTSLQRLANSRLGFTAEQTLNTAQSLYEKKLLSYPRTGSRYIPHDVMHTLPSLLKKMGAYPEGLGECAAALAGAHLSTGSVNDAKVTDHHALLPTGLIPQDITEHERSLFELVLTRLLESVSAPYEADVTHVTLTAGGTEFRVRGSVPVSMGWKGVTGNACAGGDNADDKQEPMLPRLSEGESLPLKECTKDRRLTKPRPLFTDSTLLARMETCGNDIDDEEAREAMKDCGLGTPATRAQIIERLIKLGYVQRDGRKLLPTTRGIEVWRLVEGRRIADVATTGEWERDLARIERGEMKADKFMADIEAFMREVVGDLQKHCVRLNLLPDKQCPLCGHALRDRQYSIACDAADGGCGLIIPKTACKKTLSKETLEALIKEGKTPLLKGLTGKTGKRFDAALRIDREQRKVVLDFPQEKESSIECPHCGKRLTDKGKSLACDCGLSFWKEVCGVTLSEEQIKRLLKGESVPVKGLTGKTGKKFDTTLRFDIETDRISFDFEETQSDIECPCCGKRLTDKGKSLACDCGLSFWKEVCGVTLSEEQIKRLLKGKDVPVKGLTGKNGKKFNTTLVFNKDTMKTEFKFDNGKK